MSCPHCGAAHTPPPAVCPVTGESMSRPGLLGQRIDRYELLGLLGAGGFGAVYRARHVHTEQLVALKLLKRQLMADPQMIDRLLREAKAAAAVGSQHIVRVTDASVTSSGDGFLVMELLEGMDLRELSRAQPLPPVRVALIALQILDALQAAHAKGIVHRDMKPANIFMQRVVNDTGVEKDFVKLLDFGISKMHQEGALNALTLPGMAMGTPAYMAPEQFFSARDVDGRADLYALGVVLYELLSQGRLPYEADSYADLMVKVRTATPPPLKSVAPQLGEALCAVVDRALAKDASQRWQTADQMAEGLAQAAGVKRAPRSGVAGATPMPAPSPAVRATPSSWVVTPPGKTAPLSDVSLMGRTAQRPSEVRQEVGGQVGILVAKPGATPLPVAGATTPSQTGEKVPGPSTGVVPARKPMPAWAVVLLVLGGLFLLCVGNRVACG